MINLPSFFPDWQAVYWYFNAWKKRNLLEKINCALNRLDGKICKETKTHQSLALIVKVLTYLRLFFEDLGIDANRKINGRKRQVLVDGQGRIWFAHVQSANEADGTAGVALMDDILCQDERLKKIYGDQTYNGVFAEKVKEFDIAFEKASRPESPKEFVPVAKRWGGERTLAWTNFAESFKDFMVWIKIDQS